MNKDPKLNAGELIEIIKNAARAKEGGKTPGKGAAAAAGDDAAAAAARQNNYAQVDAPSTPTWAAAMALSPAVKAAAAEPSRLGRAALIEAPRAAPLRSPAPPPGAGAVPAAPRGNNSNNNTHAAAGSPSSVEPHPMLVTQPVLLPRLYQRQRQQQQQQHAAGGGAAAVPWTAADVGYLALCYLARCYACAGPGGAAGGAPGGEVPCLCCRERARAVRLLPCGHVALCAACACLARAWAYPCCPECGCDVGSWTAALGC